MPHVSQDSLVIYYIFIVSYTPLSHQSLERVVNKASSEGEYRFLKQTPPTFQAPFIINMVRCASVDQFPSIDNGDS